MVVSAHRESITEYHQDKTVIMQINKIQQLKKFDYVGGSEYFFCIDTKKYQDSIKNKLGL